MNISRHTSYSQGFHLKDLLFEFWAISKSNAYAVMCYWPPSMTFWAEILKIVISKMASADTQVISPWNIYIKNYHQTELFRSAQKNFGHPVWCTTLHVAHR